MRRIYTLAHLAEAAFANDSDELKVINCQRLSLPYSLVEELIEEQRTNRAGLVCHTNLNLSFTTCDIVPLVLTYSVNVVKVRRKFYSSHENIVAHIICQTITTDFGLFGS